MNSLPVLQPGGPSVKGTAATAAGSTAIPALESGDPRYVHIITSHTSNMAIFRAGVATLAVALTNENGIPAGLPHGGGIILNVTGCTHIHHIRSAATDVDFYITPLANV